MILYLKRLLQSVSLISIILLMCSFSNSASAKTVHAVGIDGIRLVDKAQFDGMFNVMYQMSLDEKAGVVGSYASDDNATILEGIYKIYQTNYLSGLYFGGGGTFIDVDTGDDQVGLLGLLGYEDSPAKNVVVGIAVKMILGIDHPQTGDTDPWFLPMLTAMYAF